MRMQINRNNKQAKVKPVTSQRKLLLTIMQEAETHMDAKELYRRASEKNNNISLATVYRNLRLFAEQGLIDERRMGKMHCCCYEVKHSGEHQHLICQSCGQIIEFNSPLIRDLVAEVQRKNNFCVTRVELCLDGYCHRCKRSEEK